MGPPATRLEVFCPGAGNLISGNLGHGVEITDTGTTGNLVTGNRIGTTADGNAPLPNQLDGVSVSAGASANTIGGAIAAAGNLIAGNNNHGIEVNGTATSRRCPHVAGDNW